MCCCAGIIQINTSPLLSINRNNHTSMWLGGLMASTQEIARPSPRVLPIPTIIKRYADIMQHLFLRERCSTPTHISINSIICCKKFNAFKRARVASTTILESVQTLVFGIARINTRIVQLNNCKNKFEQIQLDSNRITRNISICL